MKGSVFFFSDKSCGMSKQQGGHRAQWLLGVVAGVVLLTVLGFYHQPISNVNMSNSAEMPVVEQQAHKPQPQPQPQYELIPLPHLSHGELVMHRGSGQYHLDNPNATYFSQYRQEDVIASLLPKRPPPEGFFFVEVGGFDGERFSNSLYFERSLGWDGLLVEANPYAYEKLLSRGRRAYSVNACLGKAEHLHLLLAGDMTFAQEHRSDYHSSKVRKMISSLRGGSNATTSRADAEPGATVAATCTPLAALLAAVPGMARPAESISWCSTWKARSWTCCRAWTGKR